MALRGTIEERGENKFLVRIFLGTDHNGKDHRPSKMVRGTIKDAKKALTAMLKDADAGHLTQGETMTLSAYLDTWLETSVKLNTRAKTYREYSGALKRYVRPKLGNKKLQKITTLDVQHVYASMSEAGLARATIIHTHAVLREALEQAVKWQLLGRNPANYVDLPKRQYKEEMYAL
jgi:integrase